MASAHVASPKEWATQSYPGGTAALEWWQVAGKVPKIWGKEPFVLFPPRKAPGPAMGLLESGLAILLAQNGKGCLFKMPWKIGS